MTTGVVNLVYDISLNVHTSMVGDKHQIKLHIHT